MRLFSRKPEVNPYEGFKVMHQMRGGLFNDNIDRVRCPEHWARLMDDVLMSGAFSAWLSADSYWPDVSKKDVRNHKDKLICEVCSGKWKPIDWSFLDRLAEFQKRPVLNIQEEKTNG